MHMRFHEEINPICGKQAKQVVQQGIFIWRRQQLKQHNIFFSLLYSLEKISNLKNLRGNPTVIIGFIGDLWLQWKNILALIF